MNDFMSALREGTRHRHSAVEETAVNRVLLSTGLTRAEYAWVLKRYLGIWKGLEQGLEKTPSIFARNPFMPRASNLENDLETLGFGPNDLKNLPRYDEAIIVSNVAEYIGQRYVLEGSQLGGKVISAHLQKIAFDSKSFSFFNDGQNTQRQWKVFCGVVNEWAGEHPSLQSTILERANQTFEALVLWFNEDELSCPN